MILSENMDKDQPLLTSDFWCTNDIRTSKTTFTWKIKGFKDNHSAYNLEGIKSGEIFVRGREDGDRDSRWMLEIKPGTIQAPLFKCPIRIVVHSKTNDSIKAQLCLQLIDSSKKERIEAGKVIQSHNFDEESSCLLWSSCHWSTITDSPDKFLVDGHLEFILDITFGNPSFSLGQATNVKVKDPSHNQKPSANFKEFLLSKEMSDIQIKCGDKTFDAHQLILSAWSPVFRGMFLAEMKEKESRMVEIQDLDSSVVLEMLKFIYTGRCCVSDEDPDPKVVKELLEAANKYQVTALKKMCEEVMIKMLEPDNSLQILEYADTYGAQELKKQALEIIVGNMKTILRSDDWKKCTKKRPRLCAVISEALANRMYDDWQ